MKQKYTRVAEIVRGESRFILWAHDFDFKGKDLTPTQLRFAVWRYCLRLCELNPGAKLQWPTQAEHFVVVISEGGEVEDRPAFETSSIGKTASADQGLLRHFLATILNLF